MHQSVPTIALVGLTTHRVQVEVTIRRGTPMIQILGLAATAARESRERIRAAAASLGLRVPGLRITVNLAPADLRKAGPSFDLPILIGILGAAGRVPTDRLHGLALVGELGLDGGLRPVRGVLPIALRCRREPDVSTLVVPLDNLVEASAVSGLHIFGAPGLSDVVAHLSGERLLAVAPPDLGAGTAPAPCIVDFGDIRGQAVAKRALEVAAAGGHNVLLRGPPGCGKTMLARRLPTILPPLSRDEALSVTAIHSAAGRIVPGEGLLAARPFRAPHHSVSIAGLIGGGPVPKPGEVSLAHHGVLFLDEMPQYPARTLDALRQPLEDGHVTVSRSGGSARFPAGFQLVGAMNPCPCGASETLEGCVCAEATIERYEARISGPLKDRIDLLVEVPRVEWSELVGAGSADDSAAVRKRVVRARRMARRRGQGTANARLGHDELRLMCAVDADAAALLRRAVERRLLNARGYWRVLRVSRTIADLAGRLTVRAPDVAESLAYRLRSGRNPSPN